MRIFLSVVTTLFMLQGCGHTCEVEDIQSQTSERAGGGATDCGNLSVSDNRNDAATCATTALQNGTPFRVTVGIQGTDSTVIIGWAFNAENQLFKLFYDSDRSGGSDEGGAITVQRCVGATSNASSSELLMQGAFFSCSSLGAAEQTCGD